MKRQLKLAFELHPAGGPFHDPALLVNFTNASSFMLLDCGTLHGLKTRDLLRVEWLILTHLHIDHLIGFDHLLRVRLFSDLPLTIFGPPGTVKVIGHRLSGYAWNLTSGSPFRVEVFELTETGAIGAAASFRCHDQFQPSDLPSHSWLNSPFEVQLLSDLTLEWHPVDHGVPCHSYRLNKSFPPKFSLDVCRSLGLEPGPWVKELMKPDESFAPMLIDGERRGKDWLSTRLLEVKKGHSLGFLTDTKLTPPLTARLAKFFRNVDVLVSETAYLNQDFEMAQRNLHMTSGQVAQLATTCGAEQLRIFHLSRRYQAEGPQAHLTEVREVFANCELLAYEKETTEAVSQENT